MSGISEGLVQNKLRDRLRSLEQRLDRIERYAPAGTEWLDFTSEVVYDTADVGDPTITFQYQRLNMTCAMRFRVTFPVVYTSGSGTLRLRTPFPMAGGSNSAMGHGVALFPSGGYFYSHHVYITPSLPSTTIGFKYIDAAGVGTDLVSIYSVAADTVITGSFIGDILPGY